MKYILSDKELKGLVSKKELDVSKKELDFANEKINMLVKAYRKLKGCEPDEDCDGCPIASLNNGLDSEVCPYCEYSK